MNEGRAREILRDVAPYNETLASLNWLIDPNDRIFWRPGDNADLDGSFSVEELEAIVWWMRNKGENQ